MALIVRGGVGERTGTKLWPRHKENGGPRWKRKDGTERGINSCSCVAFREGDRAWGESANGTRVERNQIQFRSDEQFAIFFCLVEVRRAEDEQSMTMVKAKASRGGTSSQAPRVVALLSLPRGLRPNRGDHGKFAATSSWTGFALGWRHQSRMRSRPLRRDGGEGRRGPPPGGPSAKRRDARGCRPLRGLRRVSWLIERGLVAERGGAGIES